MSRRRLSSGPITVTVKEGMVTIAERTYEDASKMRSAVYHRWPRWVEIALSRAERQHKSRRPCVSPAAQEDA